MKLPRNANLIVSGIIAGLIPNMYLVTPSFGFQPIIAGIFCAIITSVLFISANILWYNEKSIKKSSHKWRLVFFGISVISLIFAFTDLATYFLNSLLGHTTIEITHGDITLGGNSVFAMFTSFAIAGLFSLLERYVDLHEKKDV